MILQNQTPLEVGWLVGKIRPPVSSLVAIVKGTYRLKAEEVATLAEGQESLTGDQHVEDDPNRALRYASDWAHFKPHSDLLVVGHCHAPGGKPASVVRAAFHVGTFSKILSVVGESLFHDIDLSYENAYGGPNFARNPIGKQTPNLRNSKGEAREAVGFGPLPIHWPQRAAKMGTFDQKWKKERWPGLPEDADGSFANAAPEDQQIRGYLKGEEPLRFENLHPKHASYESRLPGSRIRAFYARFVGPDLRTQELEMHLDTLWVDMDSETLILVWRGLTELPYADLDESDILFVESEPLTKTPQPASTYQEKLTALLSATTEEEAAASEEPEPESELEPEPASLSREACLERLDRGESLKGEDLTGVDLSDLDLTGAQFQGAILTDAVFAGSDLPDADFTDAVLAGADFTETNLERATLANADLTGATLSFAVLRESNLAGAHFSEAFLDGADLSAAKANGADFRKADLSNGSFRGAALVEADLSGARLHGTDLGEADLTDASIEGAWGERVLADGAVLTELKASNAILPMADFRGAKAEKSTWLEAQLFSADFGEADLSGAMFDGAYLPYASFSLSTLKQARLIGCHLRRADFLRANLFCAALGKADLTGADLSESNLFFADFLEAITEGAKFDRANVKRTLLAQET